MLKTLPDELIRLLNLEIKDHQLPQAFLASITQWLLPIAESIHQHQKKLRKPIIISFNGAQGSGKSTLTHFISLLLKQHFKVESIALSLDDFYLTKQQRNTRSKAIHPLLATRGVPGTHDIDLAVKTLKLAQTCSAQTPCYIPSFDKLSDDRQQPTKWRKVTQAPEVILFEGWCLHAPIQTGGELARAINALEIKQDAAGIWRHYVNEQLKDYHKRLFSLSTLLYVIKVPSFDKVLEWRAVQEAKLDNHPTHKKMTKAELLHFIQHFERITKACSSSLPKIADCLIELETNHDIKQIIFNQPR